jgi:S-methylmethionine-dependent homocysteine/selenocysteine methylase
MGDDDLLGFEAIGEITEKEVLRDVVVAAFARCCWASIVHNDNILELLLNGKVREQSIRAGNQPMTLY